MNAQKGDHVDHRKPKETLDNRKINLRLTTNDKNTKHRKGKNKNNTSGHRNVSHDSNGNPIVQLQDNGKNHTWRDFETIEQAAKFAEFKRRELYGEFAGDD
jgi:hypothetical protein